MRHGLVLWGTLILVVIYTNTEARQIRTEMQTVRIKMTDEVQKARGKTASLQSKLAVEAAAREVVEFARINSRAELRFRWCQGNVRRAALEGWISCVIERETPEVLELAVQLFTEPSAGEQIGSIRVRYFPDIDVAEINTWGPS